jgi:hypothetical protein
MGLILIAWAIPILPLAAQERADTTSHDIKESKAKPPKATYEHKTGSGRLGKFELNGDKGKADYWYNGQHHQDDLVYVRHAEMRGPSMRRSISGFVYQVSSKGKKEPIWFFFAESPLEKGGDRHAMYYSTTAPNQDGKQPWQRILTPGGTKRMTEKK